MLVVVLILLINSADSCFKINYLEPPKCACKSLALDSSNVQNEIGNSIFYQNVSSYPIQTPVISIDDCSGSVYCAEDYSLVIFDTDKVTMFDKYSADGICDSFTQTWLVDDGSGGLSTYETLRGLCVNYAPPEYTSKPEKPCMNCPSTSIFKPSDDPNIYSLFEEEDPVDGCRQIHVQCGRADDFVCDLIGIYAETASVWVFDISEESTSVVAYSKLTCHENGMYVCDNGLTLRESVPPNDDKEECGTFGKLDDENLKEPNEGGDEDGLDGVIEEDEERDEDSDGVGVEHPLALLGINSAAWIEKPEEVREDVPDWGMNIGADVENENTLAGGASEHSNLVLRRFMLLDFNVIVMNNLDGFKSTMGV